MKIAGLLEKIKDVAGKLFGKIMDAVRFSPSSAFSKIKALFARIEWASILDSLESRFPRNFPEKMRRPALFAFAGLVALFLALIISIPVVYSGRAKGDAAPVAAADFRIREDELFFPPEPDFLPEFILERYPRGSWSVEDIRQYWKKPGNAALWRGEIKSAVDTLMEGVP